MQENYLQGCGINRTCAHQISTAPYIQSGHFCLFYQTEETPFGTVGRWYLLDTDNGQREPVPLKPSPCFSETAFTAGCGKFFFYQDHYPERAFYQYDPAGKEQALFYSMNQSLGSFQADGNWMVFVTEPDPGVLNQPEQFQFLNLKTKEHKVLTSPNIEPGRLSPERHKNWYVKDGKLFFIAVNDCWNDKEGRSLKGKIAGYDIEKDEIVAEVSIPEQVQIQQMVYKDNQLWAAGEKNENTGLYCAEIGQDGQMQEILQIKNDSYDQLVRIQLKENGLFWLKKEMKSLMENASSLWWYSLEKKETVLLMRLEELRALDIEFQVIGNDMYYKDELWKYSFCTPLDAPMTKEKIGGDGQEEKPKITVKFV